MRLALERFTQKLKMSPAEGIKVFYESYIQDTFSKYQSHPWRLEKYWNEECDQVIGENMDTLNDIYNAFAQAQSPGDPKVLRLSRFIELVTMSGVCDDSFGAREIGPLYNLAMQTNMDEINHTRHMDMRFIEFVEALARIADKAVGAKTVEFPIDRSEATRQTSIKEVKTGEATPATGKNGRAYKTQKTLTVNRRDVSLNRSSIIDGSIDQSSFEGSHSPQNDQSR